MKTPQSNLKAYEVVVVGGGASGMMAAASAARNGSSVLLIEKNARCGMKLSISGGGRCNFTNAEDDTRTLLSNYGDSAKFLHSAFSKFGMRDTIEYFEGLGMPIKVEAEKRAFPKSDSAKDVVKTLLRDLEQNHVEIMTSSEVQEIRFDNGTAKSLVVKGREIGFGSLIIATGGTSRPETGSTGDGFKWLKQAGHTIRDATPDITPLSATDDWIKHATGQTVKDAKITFYLDSKNRFKSTGDILITHFGISGPVILNSAHQVADLLKIGSVTAEIDCYPDTEEKDLDAKLEQILKKYPARSLRNSLKLIAPPGLTSALGHLLVGIVDIDKNNSEQSRASRLAVIKLLKALPLHIDKLMGYEWAVVADGGVPLTDIDTRTMRSKHISNLYITGDLLDINRPSGGYSLQLCWTSGHIAGVHAAAEA